MTTIALPCPLCLGRMEVRDSRPSKYRGRESVRRRRRCRKCGHSVTTYEIISNNAEKYADVRIGTLILSLRRAHDAMGDLINNYDAIDEQQEAAE